MSPPKAALQEGTRVSSSLTEEQQSSAAAVAEAILGKAAMNGNEHAAEVLNAENRVEPVAVAAPEPPVPSRTTPAAEAVAVTEPAVEATAPVSYDPVIPEDLAALLNEPDFEEEAAAEIQAEAEETFIENPDDAAKLRALEKRNAWLEERVVETSRKNWVAENLRAYPLLREYAKTEVEGIKATSRRGFAREAAALNTRLETIAKPMLADIRAAAATTRQEAVTEGREVARQRWGAPPGGESAVPGDAEYDARVAAAQKVTAKTGDLKPLFREMLTEINPL